MLILEVKKKTCFVNSRRQILSGKRLSVSSYFKRVTFCTCIRYLSSLMSSLLTNGKAKVNNELLARSQFHFVGRDKKNCITEASIAYRPGAV